MPEEQESILEFFAAEAIRLGADELEVEYDEGEDHIYALKSGSGFTIASLPWSTALRKELSAITRRKRVIIVDGATSSCEPSRSTASASSRTGCNFGGFNRRGAVISAVASQRTISL